MDNEWFSRLLAKAADDFCDVAQGDLKKLLDEFRYLSEPINREETQQTNSSPGSFASWDETS